MDVKYLDVSKAFGIVSHDIFINKLRNSCFQKEWLQIDRKTGIIKYIQAGIIKENGR